MSIKLSPVIYQRKRLAVASACIAVCLATALTPILTPWLFSYHIPITLDLADAPSGAVAVRWGDRDDQIVPLRPQIISAPSRKLEIIATAQKNTASAADQVWVLGVQRADGSNIPLSEFQLGSGWEQRDNRLVFLGKHPSSLTWIGANADTLSVRFLTHDWSGIARVYLDSQEQTVDLYTPKHDETRLTIVNKPLVRWSGEVVASSISNLSFNFVDGWSIARLNSISVGGPFQSTITAEAIERWGQAHDLAIQKGLRGIALTAQGKHPSIELANQNILPLHIHPSFFAAVWSVIFALVGFCLWLGLPPFIAMARGSWRRRTYRRLIIEVPVLLVIASATIVAFKLYPPVSESLVLQLNTDRRLKGYVDWKDAITGTPYHSPFDTVLDGRLTFPRRLNVSIEPAQQINPTAKSNEIWVYNIQTADQPLIHKTDLQLGSEWSQQQLQYVGLLPNVSIYNNRKPTTPLTYTPYSYGQWAVLHLLHHPWSGIAKVQVNGYTEEIDLYKDGLSSLETHIIAPPPAISDTVTIEVPVYRLAGGPLRVEFSGGPATILLQSAKLNSSRVWYWKSDQPLAGVGGNLKIEGQEDGAQVLHIGDTANGWIEFTHLPPLFVVDWTDFVLVLALIFVLAAVWRVLVALAVHVIRLFSRERPIAIGARPPTPILVIYVALIAAALCLQIMFISSRTVLFSTDSGDYMVGGFEVWRRFDFSRSNDWRPPGYIAFIGLAYTIFGYTHWSILIAQACLLIVSVGLALVLGRLVAGWYAGMGVSLFVALHPGFLLASLLVMTEALTIPLLLATLIAGWCYFIRPYSIRYAVLFALCTTISVLVRKNMLLVSLPVLVFVLLRGYLLAQDSRKLAYRIRRIGLTLGLWTCTYMTLTAPWLYRNYQTYGIADISPNTQRGRLLFFGQQNLIDDRLPAFQPSLALNRYTMGGLNGVLQQVLTTRTTVESEAKAKTLVQEQIRTRPLTYAYAILQSLTYQLGFHRDNISFNQRLHTRLLDEVAFDINAWHQQNEIYKIYGAMGTYINMPAPEGGKDNWATRLWGIWWNNIFRYSKRFFSILSIATILLAAYYILSKQRSDSSQDILMPLFFFGCTYCCIQLGHAYNLAEHDRYILPFEWIPVLIVLMGFSVAVSLISHIYQQRTRLSAISSSVEDSIDRLPGRELAQ